MNTNFIYSFYAKVQQKYWWRIVKKTKCRTKKVESFWHFWNILLWNLFDFKSKISTSGDYCPAPKQWSNIQQPPFFFLKTVYLESSWTEGTRYTGFEFYCKQFLLIMNSFLSIQFIWERNEAQVSSHTETELIVKILNIYIMLSCTHLYHFSPVSIHYLQCIHCLLIMWRNI